MKHASSFVSIFCTFLFFSACTSTPSTTAHNGIDPLDEAIRVSSDYLKGRLNKGVKIVFLNFQSECPAFSEYIIDGLIENTVNDGFFTVVDRQNLTLIQQEMNFQLSGEVSDESAQAIGKLLGAQVIVSGAITSFGNDYRLRIRAISVETAEIQGQFSQDVVSSNRLAVILANCGARTSPSNYPNQAASQTVSKAESSVPASTTALPYELFTTLRRLDITNVGEFAVSPDGKYALVNSNIGRKLCDTETGKVIKNIGTPSFTAIAFSPNGKRVVTGSGSKIRILDIGSGSYRDCTGHTGMISSLAYSPDGPFFVSASWGSNDNMARVWDAETGQEVMGFGHDKGVGSALFSPDGKLIISRDENNIYFWNIADGKLVRKISVQSYINYPKLLEYSSDGTKIAAAFGNRIIVYDMQSGREIFNLTGQMGNIVGMKFNPEGNRLISVSQGQKKNIMVWNMASGWGTEVHPGIGGDGYSSLDLSLDGKVLVVGTSGRRVYVLGLE